MRQRIAFRNRITFFDLIGGHDSDEIFPYNAPMLAKLLLILFERKGLDN